MTEWEYLWRQTYWKEIGRSSDYARLISYEHFWKPDRNTEELFPNDNGLDALGKGGWELVSMAPQMVALKTRESPQGDNYSQFQSYLLMFKRQLRTSGT